MKVFLLLLLLAVFPIQSSFATNDPILITISQGMKDIIFDGKWTHVSEWKQSSHNLYSYHEGNAVIHLRTDHFGNFIYVFVDPINDLTLDLKKDQTMICFDVQNNENQIYDMDDFCFSVLFDDDKGNVYQGTSLDQ